jgi:hypothetical protein
MRLVKKDKEEDKSYPIRQPSIPLSIEALQTGNAGNFVRER